MMFTALGFLIGLVDRRSDPCWFYPNTPYAVRRTARMNAAYGAARCLTGRA